MDKKEFEMEIKKMLHTGWGESKKCLYGSENSGIFIRGEIELQDYFVQDRIISIYRGDDGEITFELDKYDFFRIDQDEFGNCVYVMKNKNNTVSLWLAP